MILMGIPSGKLTKSYWTWPFIVDLPSYKMVIFHSYVSLPEGYVGNISNGNIYAYYPDDLLDYE